MKKNRISKSIAIVLCVPLFLVMVLCVFCFILLLFLMRPGVPAQTHWSGVDQSGAIIVDGDSPIVVEKGRLTLDLQEFPKNGYADQEEFFAYTGKMTAEYTFYNPSDTTVTEKLLLPFGCKAYYAIVYDHENSDFVGFADDEKYNVLVNGKAIEKKDRYTLSSDMQQFDLDRDLGLISDTFAQDDFYTAELTVTRYTFEVSGVDIERYKQVMVRFEVQKGLGDYRIYFPEMSGASAHTPEDETMGVYACVRETGHELELYVFGTPLDTMPEWKIYESGSMQDDKLVDGTVELIGTEHLTFKEFALANWTEESGVSAVDWYNATIAEIKDSNIIYDNYPVVQLGRYAKKFREGLRRWYEYEITVEPGEHIVNTVTAPIYPSINLRYEPSIYSYTHLLSSAKTWKSFGELEIVINTPYYVSSCSIDGFTKTEAGYTAKLNGLPDSELTFNLSTSENPKRPKAVLGYISWIMSIIGRITPWAIVMSFAGIVIMLVVTKKRKRRQRELKDLIRQEAERWRSKV